MQNTFKVLPIEEVKIIKRINIVSQDRFGNDIIIGFILYQRGFSADYKFKETKEEDRDFAYFISYPRQEDFPTDSIDDLLLQTIQNNYPKSYIFNQLKFTTSDVEQFKNLINRPSEKSDLVIRPDFTGQQYERLVEIDFTSFNEEIKVFVEGSSQLIKGLNFYGNCNFENRNEIYQQLEEIEFI